MRGISPIADEHGAGIRDMASQYGIERERGIKEAGQQLAALRERWPLAFPVQAQDVRPLRWASPSRAVLSHDQRIALDGAPAETVDAEAKDLAAKQLAQLAARKAAKQTAPTKAKPSGTANRYATAIAHCGCA
jgi:sRNA-binding protein